MTNKLQTAIKFTLRINYSNPRSRVMRIGALLVLCHTASCLKVNDTSSDESSVHSSHSSSKSDSSRSGEDSVEDGYLLRDSSRSFGSEDEYGRVFRVQRDDGRYDVFTRDIGFGSQSSNNDSNSHSHSSSGERSKHSDSNSDEDDEQVLSPVEISETNTFLNRLSVTGSINQSENDKMRAATAHVDLEKIISAFSLAENFRKKDRAASNSDSKAASASASEIRDAHHGAREHAASIDPKPANDGRNAKNAADNHDSKNDFFASDNGQDAKNPPVTCIDSNGNRVDWWIAYICDINGHYVEYTSQTAAVNPGMTSVRALHTARTFFNKETSPMLRTVYDNLSPDTPLPAQNEQESSVRREMKDTRMFFAWNDAQPSAAKKTRTSKLELDLSQLSISSTSSGGKNAKVVNGDVKDMYDWGVDMGAAHSKGMVGLGFDQVRKLASFYLLTHSFPEVPNGAEWHATLPVKRRRPPADPNAFFGSNIKGTKSKAQHAMCMSMTQTVEVNAHGEIVFDAGAIDHDRQNLFALLDGLDVIHPAMVMTDYDPWAQRHRAYHQLFNVSTTWLPTRWADGSVFSNSNVARKNNNVPSRSKHAFPLWPTSNNVTVSKVHSLGVQIPVATTYTAGRSLQGSPSGPKVRALRTSNQFKSTRCQRWDAAAVSAAIRLNGVFDGRTLPLGAQCFLSVTLTTTGRDGPPLVIAGDYKHALAPVDLDDILRRHVVSGVDIRRAAAADKKANEQANTSTRRHNVSLVVVVQSWQDHATQAPQRSTAVDLPGYRVVVWYMNSAGALLANAGAQPYVQQASSDHAKWFVSYLYGDTGAYTGVAGVMDLNRNRKMTLLSSDGHGRSGAVYTTCDPAVVRFFYALPSELDDNAAFRQTDLGVSRLADTRKAIVVRNDVNAQTMDVRFDDGHSSIIRSPFMNTEDVCQRSSGVQLQPSNCAAGFTTSHSREPRWTLGSRYDRDDSSTPPRQRNPPGNRRLRHQVS